jgi:hypothetical protein
MVVVDGSGKREASFDCFLKPGDRAARNLRKINVLEGVFFSRIGADHELKKYRSPAGIGNLPVEVLLVCDSPAVEKRAGSCLVFFPPAVRDVSKMRFDCLFASYIFKCHNCHSLYLVMLPAGVQREINILPRLILIVFNNMGKNVCIRP